MAVQQESLLSKVSDAIRSGTIGKEVKRSAKWFQDKIKGLKGEVRNRFSKTNARTFYREAPDKFNPGRLARRPNLGDIFCYWYNPKHRATLPYYDMFPMIMLIGYEQDTFLGLNFHYLRPKLRAILLDRVNAKIGKAIPKWSKLAKLPYIEPAVKRYRYDHIMKKVVPIAEDEQELAIFLPLERFKKASKSKVWAASTGR
tara:strand:+ start:407 stop:1006 length:600 start_codon:yes stop_codon:yes gene_type:complete